MNARLIALGIAILAVIGIIAMIYHKGETAGGDKVTVAVEREHGARIVEARGDERAAADVTKVVADRAVRLDAKSDAILQTTIKDLRDALDAVPPAVAGAPLPAAPVDQLRGTLNQGIARANRAAADADPPE